MNTFVFSNISVKQIKTLIDPNNLCSVLKAVVNYTMFVLGFLQSTTLHQ